MPALKQAHRINYAKLVARQIEIERERDQWLEVGVDEQGLRGATVSAPQSGEVVNRRDRQRPHNSAYHIGEHTVDDLTKQVINVGIIISFNQGVEAAIEFCKRHPHLPAHTIAGGLGSLLRSTRECEIAAGENENSRMLVDWIGKASEPWFTVSENTETP